MTRHVSPPAKSSGLRMKRELIKNRYLYFMICLPIVYFIIFKYLPMYGIVIAFQNFKIYKGYFGSDWVGLKHFSKYLSDPGFWVLVKNTLMLSLWQIVFCFPLPIIFALSVNELRNRHYKNLVQNVSYLPHFISTVVVISMLSTFAAKDGLFNDIASGFGLERVSYMLKKDWFRPLYVISDLWQTMGWSAIIYLAALAGVDPQIYEAAQIDGAGRFRQILNVTLPSIMPTITIMFILRMGSVLSVSFEKVLLMQNVATYETSDVISTFVYRRGLAGSQYSYATAVDIFSSVINLCMLYGTNFFSRRIGQNSLW